jgi:hypothetical protein
MFTNGDTIIACKTMLITLMIRGLHVHMPLKTNFESFTIAGLPYEPT